MGGGGVRSEETGQPAGQMRGTKGNGRNERRMQMGGNGVSVRRGNANCCVDYCHGGHQGNTERVVARWQRSVASGETLVMLHWAMNAVLHRRTTMAIKLTYDGGAFVRCRLLFCLA